LQCGFVLENFSFAMVWLLQLDLKFRNAQANFA